MRCFHPLTIYVDGKGYVQVPCGKCFACQQAKRKNWYFRIKQEEKDNIASYFFTLTYDNEHLPPAVPFMHSRDGFEFDHVYDYHPFDYRDMQLFLKRMRKKIGKFRYFGVCEYGSQRGRPHFHLIVFFDHFQDLQKLRIATVKSWPLGREITVEPLTDRRISYVTKYCIKHFNSLFPPSKTFCSTRPYIGNGYMTESKLRYHYKNSTDQSSLLGYKQRIPRIYRDKFLDDSIKDELSEYYQTFIEESADMHVPINDDPLSPTPYEIQKKRLIKQCLKTIKNSQL